MHIAPFRLIQAENLPKTGITELNLCMLSQMFANHGVLLQPGQRLRLRSLHRWPSNIQSL